MLLCRREVNLGSAMMMKFLLVFCTLVLLQECCYGYPQVHRKGIPDQMMSASNIDQTEDMYMAASEQQMGETQYRQLEPESGGQTFFPSYYPYHDPPLGHSRPFFFQQEAAYSQRPSSFHQQLGFESSPRFSGYKGDNYGVQASSSDTHGLLGSGNFGVIRGGTFYNDNDGDAKFSENYNSYFNNGHGRPSYYYGGVPNPKPQQQEQFANFRDFADINTPANPAYSQFVVVYVNKNGTKPTIITNSETVEPKNIIERLAMLDLEATPPTTTTTTTELIPTKKLSKSKRKLALVLPEKKIKIKKSKVNKEQAKDLYEPLLALS